MQSKRRRAMIGSFIWKVTLRRETRKHYAGKNQNSTHPPIHSPRVSSSCGAHSQRSLGHDHSLAMRRHGIWAAIRSSNAPVGEPDNAERIKHGYHHTPDHCFDPFHSFWWRLVRSGPVVVATPKESQVVGLHCPSELLAAIDEWRRKQPDTPKRPEALRRLLRLALYGKNESVN
jgi:hypothetical protein